MNASSFKTYPQENTIYVDADPSIFRAVVQKLTGASTHPTVQNLPITISPPLSNANHYYVDVACIHLINRDYDELAKIVSLGLIPPGSDKDAVSEALTGLFTNAIANGVDNVSFGDLFANLGKTIEQLLLGSNYILEGIAYSFNPKYKVLGGAYPWIARKVLTNSSPQLKASLQQLLYKGGVFRIDSLESLVAEVFL
ncbi:hypothetical protein POM88_024925 [Heracleum sosnowskyi]|uniref:VQ domain-containing protein n=1 Tax=Heracleum sosnowskyi TaxID=360622 RepID=A0AAD8MLW9_9APIA|nr:hypothetical protein POM88_024925 [Heracleum sosnowskyi]